MKDYSRLMTMLAAAWLAAGLSVHAASIIQDAEGELKGFFSTTFGQSFIAEDAKISSIRISLMDAPFPFPGGLEFTATLFEGQGFGGPSLGSATRTFESLPLWDNNFVPNFVDFDFSAVTLNVGQSYTFQIRSASGRGMAGASGHLYGDVYPGGIAYAQTTTPLPTPIPGEDMVFEVIAAPLPTLQIGVSAEGIVLSWPLAFSQFRLEQSPASWPLAWETVTNAVVATTGQNQVTVRRSEEKALFRLSSP